MRDVLRDSLTQLGYTVVTVSNADEAVSRFRERMADLLVTDLSMPGVSGWGLITTLVARQPRLPVIVITGTGISMEDPRCRVRRDTTWKAFHPHGAGGGSRARHGNSEVADLAGKSFVAWPSTEVIETFRGVSEPSQEHAMTTWTVAGPVVARRGRACGCGSSGCSYPMARRCRGPLPEEPVYSLRRK